MNTMSQQFESDVMARVLEKLMEKDAMQVPNWLRNLGVAAGIMTGATGIYGAGKQVYQTGKDIAGFTQQAVQKGVDVAKGVGSGIQAVGKGIGEGLEQATRQFPTRTGDVAEGLTVTPGEKETGKAEIASGAKKMENAQRGENVQKVMKGETPNLSYPTPSNAVTGKSPIKGKFSVPPKFLAKGSR